MKISKSVKASIFSNTKGGVGQIPTQEAIFLKLLDHDRNPQPNTRVRSLVFSEINRPQNTMSFKEDEISIKGDSKVGALIQLSYSGSEYYLEPETRKMFLNMFQYDPSKSNAVTVQITVSI